MAQEIIIDKRKAAEFRLARMLVGTTIIGVLTADTLWLLAPRDQDILSRVNPWVTLVLSLEIALWAYSSKKFVSKCSYKFKGLEIGLDEGLWLTFGWWMILIVRLGWYPQPHQVVGFDRDSWFCVYVSMAIFSLGNWLLRQRFQ